MARFNDPRTGAIIGAALYVHNILGFGFLERVYHEALSIEFTKRGIPFVSEVNIPINYDGTILKAHYRADFVCYGSIIVEIKAIAEITSVEIAQVLNYLKATGYDPALLLNFGSASLEKHRIRNKFLKP